MFRERGSVYSFGDISQVFFSFYARVARSSGIRINKRKEGQISQIHIVIELRNRLIWIQFNLGCVDKGMSPPGDRPCVSIYILDFLTV